MSTILHHHKVRKVLRSLVILAFCLVLIVVLPAPRSQASLNAVRNLDPTFGTGGLVTTNIGRVNSRGTAVALQPDGKIVVAGEANHIFTLLRYNSDGSLDISFGDRGRVLTEFGTISSWHAIALQTDGKIVVAGETYTGIYPYDYTVIVLARYQGDGSLDASFGDGGIVSTNFSHGSDIGNAVKLQADGKILVAGHTLDDYADNNFILLRYNANGSLDTSLGGDGIVTTDFSGGEDLASALTLQPDGKILVAGTSDSDFALARYNSNGSLDTGFHVDGKVTSNIRGNDQAHAVVLQLDGKIVVAGTSTGSDTNADFALVRYTSDGSLDLSFNTDGITTTDYASYTDAGYALALQPNGKLLVSGTTGNNFALARYNIDGSLSVNFDVDGKVTTDFAGDLAVGYSIALQSDDKIVVAGKANNDFALARYTTEGALDSSFGEDGKVTTEFDNTDSGSAIALQADGKILVAGTAIIDDVNANDFGLVRYHNDGSLDASFSGDGKVTTDFDHQGDTGKAVALQADGKIVLAGTVGGDTALARYNPDGSLDLSFSADGKVTTNFGANEECSDIAVQADGKLVSVGYAYIDSSNSYDFTLARFNSNGSLDATLDGDGRVTTHLGSNDYAMDVALQPDGKIISAGWTKVGDSTNFALVRYNSDGTLDTSFGGGGIVITDIAMGCCDERAMGIVLLPGGEILVAGYAFGDTTGYDFVLLRYTNRGLLDNKFSSDGQVNTDFGGNEMGYDVALHADGKIVVAGNAGDDFALARYNQDGSLDTSFGDGGKLVTDFGGDSSATAVAIQADGKILLAGAASDNYYPYYSDFALARYVLTTYYVDYLPFMMK